MGCLLDPSMMDHDCEFESAIIEGECIEIVEVC